MKVEEIRITRKHNLQKIKLAYESLEIGITAEDATEVEAFKELERIWRKFCEMYAAGEIQ